MRDRLQRILKFTAAMILVALLPSFIFTGLVIYVAICLLCHFGVDITLGTKMICTHCEGTGFLNADQIPEWVAEDAESILEWLETSLLERDEGGCSCHISSPCGYCINFHDVEECDCCGDGEGWYGEPGQHYGPDDPRGDKGPYAANGGLCQCH